MPRCSAALTPSSCAFTLIELLVVVAIIGLLLAILLPSLANAKETARSVVCLSNLRQMVIAAHAYAGESRDDYPMAYFYKYEDGVSTSYAWDLTTIGTGASARVVPGVLWRSDDPTKIHQCPSFAGKANWGIDPYTGYNYNTSYIGHGEYEAIPAPTKLSAVLTPTGTVIFGDGQYAAGANKFMRAPFENDGDITFAGRWAGTQGFRHLGNTNAAFCDGHASSMRERFTENEDGKNNVAEGTGFLSPDNTLYDLK